MNETIQNELDEIQSEIDRLMPNQLSGLSFGDTEKLLDLQAKYKQIQSSAISETLSTAERIEADRIAKVQSELSQIFECEVLITRNDYVCEIFERTIKFYDVNITDVSIIGVNTIGIKLDVAGIESLLLGIRYGMILKATQLACNYQLPIDEITEATPF